MALLAVAPLFLFPFCSADAVASVLLWLSLLVSLWVAMSPSCRPGEMPHDARARLSGEIVRDPLTWVLLLAVAFAGLRALNDGIGLAYDAETMAWSIKPPLVDIFSGSVPGRGFLPFAASVAAFVMLTGTRHCLDPDSSIAFFVAASAFAGLAAIVSAIALSYGNARTLEMVACSYESPSFAGTAYGLHMIGGVVALFCSAAAGWRRAEPFAAFGLVCSAVGLEIFSPPATFAVFAIAFLLMLVAAFPLMKSRFAGSASFRCAMAVAMVFAAVAIVAMFGDSCGALLEKRDALLGFKLFPDGFASSRDALSGIALKSWRQSPWLGSGLGSFPIDVRFCATQADWLLISPRQDAPLSCWWQLLAERGIVGTVVIAIGAGFLAWTYFAALARSFGGERWTPACIAGPFSAAALVALAFVDCSLLRPDVILPAVAVLALSAVAFRRCGRGQGT